MLYQEFYKTSSLSKIDTESCNGEEIFKLKLFIAQFIIQYNNSSLVALQIVIFISSS